MFPIQSYEKADSVDDAIRLLSANPEAKPIAGGTDLLIRLRDGKKAFGHLVDIHDLAELKQCAIDAAGTLLIGSGVRFSDALASDIIRNHLPHLHTAAGTVGGPQIRNIATIGGNICNGVTSADSASPLLASEAQLIIQGPAGRRETPLSDFFMGPGKVALAQNEILIAFAISRENYRGYAGDYYKFAMREAMDIATIGCAATCKVSNHTLVDLRLALGVAAPTPIRCRHAESVARGQPLTEELLKKIETAVAEDVNPRTSWRASKEFRRHIIKELVGRVVRNAIHQAGGTNQ
ncbi:xanthine dehydrogenase FAD-binding subunit XdhB [bacterium]|nr:xanthine dehydrogenase FAD-binding subunit XdhB [bacterium]